MFYRMSRLHFDDERFGELLEWAESVKPKVQQIEGLVFADIARTGSGEGMIIAGFKTHADFGAVRDEVSGIIDDMAEYLTDRPHTHAGSSEFSFVDGQPA